MKINTYRTILEQMWQEDKNALRPMRKFLRSACGAASR